MTPRSSPIPIASTSPETTPGTTWPSGQTGGTRHYCLGAQLARLELRVLFEEVLDRWSDLALAEPGGPRPERTGNFVLGIEELPVTF